MTYEERQELKRLISEARAAKEVLATKSAAVAAARLSDEEWLDFLRDYCEQDAA